MYRGLKLWEAAVQEAGSLEQDDVIAALDHASIAEGPGGPAEMVPGQHHVRMNMYIAQAKNGRFEIVESLGADRSEGARAGLTVAGNGARGQRPAETRGSLFVGATNPGAESVLGDRGPRRAVAGRERLPPCARRR